MRIGTFIDTGLLQTGHILALNITAEKATYKHHTRQFLSCVTVVPGAEELLQVISFGQPIVKGHKGIEIAKNIKDGLDAFNLQSSQIEGGSFDGQYFHLRVEEALESPALYDIPPKNVLWAWDALHKMVSKTATFIKKKGSNGLWMMLVCVPSFFDYLIGDKIKKS